MTEVKTNTALTIETLVDACIADRAFMDALCVFTQHEVEEITPGLVCFLSEYPTIENDLEVFSPFVIDKSLELLYYGEQFNDVVRAAVDLKPKVTHQTLIAALNYYLENDDFMDV